MAIYRETPTPCPRCTVALETRGTWLTCHQCQGFWIQRDELRDLIRDIAPDLHPEIELPIHARESAAPLPCPFAAEELAPGRLGPVAIDHCVHGVWFDGEELDRTLRAIGDGFSVREGARVHVHAGAKPGAFWTGEETLHEALTRFVRWALRRPPEP